MIYLSYAHEDASYVKQLVRELVEFGLEVWSATREIFPGDNWAQAIGEALEKADAMVVIISPASGTSPWAESEISYALGQQRFKDRVFPVKLGEWSGMPWIMRRFPSYSGKPEEVARQIAIALDAFTHPDALARAGAR